MAESWASRRARWTFNLFPAYRGTGARVEYIAADWREVRIRLPLTWRNRNYVGTIGRTTLRGAFRLETDRLEQIRADAMRNGKLDTQFEVNLTDAAGVVHASCTKTVYVRWRKFPRDATTQSRPTENTITP